MHAKCASWESNYIELLTDSMQEVEKTLFANIKIQLYTNKHKHVEATEQFEREHIEDICCSWLEHTFSTNSRGHGAGSLLRLSGFMGLVAVSVAIGPLW